MEHAPHSSECSWYLLEALLRCVVGGPPLPGQGGGGVGPDTLDVGGGGFEPRFQITTKYYIAARRDVLKMPFPLTCKHISLKFIFGYFPM